MVRPVGLLVTALVLAGDAGGATFFFQAVPATASAACPAPCYQIRMFYEDETRSLSVSSVALDIEVLGDAIVATLPVPPATGPTAGHGNAFVNLMPQPWNQYSVVGKSPDPEFDARVVDESDPALTVDSVSALFAAGCAGAGCAIISAGLAADRIYLGRFDLTWNGGPAGVRAKLLTPQGAGTGTVFDVDGLSSILDQDGDGWLNQFDNCPSLFNPDQADSDGDRVGDACNDAIDTDGDERRDSWDNCPAIANPGQENRDGDGMGDVCDLCPDYPTLDNADFDGNGIGDPCECGDQTQDAVVNVLDLLGINLVIFRAVRESPLCDTNFDGRCNVADIVGANRKILGEPAYCSRYPPPGP